MPKAKRKTETELMKENRKLRNILADCANIAGAVMERGGSPQLSKIINWDEGLERADGPYMDLSESVSYPKYNSVKSSPGLKHHASWAEHLIQEWERRYYQRYSEPLDVLIADLIADIAHYLDVIGKDSLSDDCNTLQQIICKAESSYQDECRELGEREGHQFDAV